MKYYAVKKGTTVGVFTDWETCKTSVDGYPGAEYKSFKTKKEAKAYLDGTVLPESEKELEKPVCEPDTIIAYTDGSYDVVTGRYAFGCVLFMPDGSVTQENGAGDDPEAASSRNVAGELMGVMFAVKTAAKEGYRKLIVYHDYEGVSAWYENRWKANSFCAKKYLEFMNKYRPHMNISFVKVEAHTGVELNELADKLAKRALGI